ncbi:MAG: hypothetical protein ACQGVC_16710, partial [Myxococcota bacterium]
SPFHQFATVQDIAIFRFGRPGHRLGNALIYPAALLYALWSLAPLAAFGVARALAAPGRPRALALGVLASLAVLAASAGRGTNVTPFRTVLPLAAALVPLGVAALFQERERGAPRPARERLGWGLAAAAFCAFVGVQHDRVFAAERLSEVAWTKPRMELPEAMELSDTLALGTWMRREFTGDGTLSEENLAQPIRLFVGADHKYHWFEWLFLQYAIGDPGRLASAERGIHEEPDLRAEVRALEPGQLLISNRPVRDRRARELFRVGRYAVYEGRR